MATETLTCQICGVDWTRELKRGRKPTKCADCLSGKSKHKSPVNEERLKNAEKKYKQRVQMLGNHLKPLGDGELIQLPSGLQYTKYDGYEFDDGDRMFTVKEGTFLRERGMGYRFKFRSLIVRKDGTAYAELIGVNREYEGKFRAIGVENLTVA